MKIGAFSIAIASILLAVPAPAETLSNNSIIAMTKAGLSEGLIIDKINSEACNYDLATGDLISLKQVGVSENAIGAMVRRCATLSQQRGVSGNDTSSDPKIRHSPGIYVFEDWLSPPKLQVIRPSKPSGLKTSGNGSIVFPLMTKMILPGTHSHSEVLNQKPVFYFYFNISDEKVSDFGTENSLAAQSPDEFSLVKFSKNPVDREIVIGRMSLYNGLAVTARKGVDAKYTILFQTEDMGNGTYKVAIDKILDAGEYAFLFTGASGNARIYDFTIENSMSQAK